MMSVLPRRDLGAVAVLGLLIAGVGHGAAVANEPREWLEKMNRALATRNYDGTFFHLSDGQVETMRIVHRVHAGRVTERLVSMDGSGREFVRNNEELTCYLPDKKTVLVESRRDESPFLGSLPQFNESMNEFYQLRLLPAARILGRNTRVITVTPKDQFRFGYRLWLDEQTAMPLKTQLCDAQGQVVEQILFANLEMPESIPESSVQPGVQPKGMRWVRQSAAGEPPPAAVAAFKASRLPPGFRLAVSGAQTLDGGDSPATHLVYSDGVATVSVFVESTPRSTMPHAASVDNLPMQGLARVGAGYAFSTTVQGHQVTAVGEVPAQTVEFIAHSVSASGTFTKPH